MINLIGYNPLAFALRVSNVIRIEAIFLLFFCYFMTNYTTAHYGALRSKGGKFGGEKQGMEKRKALTEL